MTHRAAFGPRLDHLGPIGMIFRELERILSHGGVAKERSVDGDQGKADTGGLAHVVAPGVQDVAVIGREGLAGQGRRSEPELAHGPLALAKFEFTVFEDLRAPADKRQSERKCQDEAPEQPCGEG